MGGRGERGEEAGGERDGGGLVVVAAAVVFFFIQHLSAGIRSMVIFASSRN